MRNAILLFFAATVCSAAFSGEPLEPQCGGENHATVFQAVMRLKNLGYLDAVPKEEDVTVTPIGYKRIGIHPTLPGPEGDGERLLIYEQTQHVTIARPGKPDIVLITEDDVTLGDCTQGSPKIIMLAPDLGILPYSKDIDGGYENILTSVLRWKNDGNNSRSTPNLIGFPVRKP
jgi:hypothetical protein